LTVKSKAVLKGRTLPCKICGELYTDNIDPVVDSTRGGYIICARCTMKLAVAPAPEVEIDPDTLIEAINNRQFAQFRKALGLTHEDLAGRLGIKRTQYYKIEKGQYIQSLMVLNRFKSKLMHTKPLAA